MRFEASQTLSQILRRCRSQLERAGVSTPALDARVIVMAVLKLDHTRLISEPDRQVADRDSQTIAALVDRRVTGEPVSRLFGAREFYGRIFNISAATLDPRPDTECLVEWALRKAASRQGSKDALRVLDVGTGSGAIIVTLLSELPRAHGIGTDISKTALLVAGQNARLHGVMVRLKLVQTNWAQDVIGPFDLIVTNPPYIQSAAIASLACEVSKHDPHLALDGGGDGLAAYRAMVPDVIRLLAPGGYFLAEVGEGQDQAVQELFCAAGLEVPGDEAGFACDLAGVRRVVGLRAMR